jgi:hypothetical protein
MVTYAQAAASHPSTSEISTQTDSVPTVPETDGLEVCPHQPRMQTKPADLPKHPQAHESRKLFPHIAFLIYTMTADGKSKGAPTNPKSSTRT